MVFKFLDRDVIEFLSKWFHLTFLIVFGLEFSWFLEFILVSAIGFADIFSVFA